MQSASKKMVSNAGFLVVRKLVFQVKKRRISINVVRKRVKDVESNKHTSISFRKTKEGRYSDLHRVSMCLVSTMGEYIGGRSAWKEGFFFRVIESKLQRICPRNCNMKIIDMHDGFYEIIIRLL